jgi:16S rRNA (cytosine967-C5)-methyltransferase
MLQRREVSELKDADRRLVTELVMGVLRWRGELDFHIQRLSGRPLKRLDPEVVTILRLGIYQIRYLAKIPKAAVVNEAVELTKAARKRSAAGLVNAVLRQCAPATRRLDRAALESLTLEDKESICRVVPAWLLDRWAAHAGPGGRPPEGEATPPAEAGVGLPLRLAWASLQVPPTTLRVVPLGCGITDWEELRRELAGEGISTRQLTRRYAPRALVVESGSIQASRAFREGRVVIQDEASQLVAALLAPRAGERVLDLCAAPGLKTGQLAQMLGRGMLVACDLSASRMRTLAKLLLPQVPPEVRLHLVRLDATEQLPFAIRFDRILLDVPCSGTGTLSRNPEIKWRLQPRDFSRLAIAQGRMLRQALEVMAPGGRLVYATCSLEPEENEQVVEKVLEEVRGYRVLTRTELGHEFPAQAPLFDSGGYFRTRPDVHQTDGFFAAVITRTT